MECGGRGGLALGAAHVKEEPGWGLIDQVNVKEEAESTDEEAECVKVEASSDSAGPRGLSEAALLAGLYTDHTVKDELVLGPEGVQASPSCSDNLGPRRPMDARDESAGLSRERRGEEHSLRECSVRLERVSPRGAPPARARRPALHTPKSAHGPDIEDGYTTADHEQEPMCDLCGRRFALKSDLMKHVVHSHMPAGEEQHEGSGDDQDGDLPRFLWRWARLVPRACRVRLERCDATRPPSAPRDAPPHTRETFLHNVENTYECDICKRRFTLKRHLNLHMTALHSPNISQVLHKRIHRTNGLFTCECKKKFLKLRDLLAHIDVKGGKKYPCDICKRFITKSVLKRHALTHTGEKPFSCEICKRNFSYLSSLKSHKEIVHNVTSIYKYTCEICNKRCGSSTALLVHKRVHSGEKPYFCGVCNKRFTQSGDLKAHKRIHTGEKPFPCEICKKRFRRSTDLYRHKRVHTGEKPHCCQTCQKKFYRLFRLTEHIRKHTGEKPFCCEICPELFSCYDDLRCHKRIHENKANLKRGLRRAKEKWVLDTNGRELTRHT